MQVEDDEASNLLPRTCPDPINKPINKSALGARKPKREFPNSNLL